MRILRSCACFFLLFAIPIAVTAQGDPVAPVISEEVSRIEDNQKSQQRIDRIHDNTGKLVSDYQDKLKIVDGLKVYNALLARQLQRQQSEIDSLNFSIANAAVLERQMMPLLLRMLDGLERFIVLDVPFLLQEREQRVHRLRMLMERADLTVAEKSRRVFEAFQIENDFGRTLESYKGKLNVGDKSFDVDYLRIGRIAFLYRSIGADQYGYWDNHARQWVVTDSSQYQRNIEKGLKVAKQEMAPELFMVPIAPAEEER